MIDIFANDFYEIMSALSKNSELNSKVLSLIESRLEEETRKNEFRDILKKFVKGEIIDLSSTIYQVQIKIPKSTSKYASDNRVFTRDWAERLLRTQLSLFYNQAVMEILIDSGKEEFFIPHSKYEDHNSFCTREMAKKK